MKRKRREPVRLPPGEPLSLQDRAFADEWMKNPDKRITSVGTKMGFTPHQSWRTMDKPAVRDYIAGFLDAAQASIEKSCRVIAEAHDAVLADKSGAIIADHLVRLKAAEMNLKYRGLLNLDADQSGPRSIASLIVNIQQERQRRGLK